MGLPQTPSILTPLFPMNGWRVMTNLSKQWNNKNRGALCRNAPTCANGRFQRGLTFALMRTNVLGWARLSLRPESSQVGLSDFAKIVPIFVVCSSRFDGPRCTHADRAARDSADRRVLLPSVYYRSAAITTSAKGVEDCGF